jgi:hypothetical protein
MSTRGLEQLELQLPKIIPIGHSVRMANGVELKGTVEPAVPQIERAGA